MSAQDVIASSPPILERIFSYLNARDLDSCTMVCSFWKRMTETEKKHRKEFQFFFEATRCEKNEECNLGRITCIFGYYVDIEAKFMKQLVNIQTHPYFCFLFISSSTVDNITKLFPSFSYPKPLFKRSRTDGIIARRNYLKAVVNTTVKQHLPKNCDIALCVPSGIIGWRPDNTPMDVENGGAISGLLIPKIRGVSIHRFSIDDQHWNISEKIPSTRPIKCLLFFVSYRGINIINKILQACMLRSDTELAVGGTVVDRAEMLLGNVVAFCGRNVQAASVVTEQDDKKPDIEKKLLLFRDSGLLENKCIAFMFACVARGRNHYREPNPESSLFNRLYPNVPLVGTFGNGEIGLDFMPNRLNEENADVKIKAATSSRRYRHSYTTVFVMISFKMD